MPITWKCICLSYLVICKSNLERTGVMGKNLCINEEKNNHMAIRKPEKKEIPFFSYSISEINSIKLLEQNFVVKK